MVQPTASVEERLGAAVAASEAETAAKPAAGRPKARMASTPVRTAPRAQVERSAAAPSVERAEARPMAAAPEREAAVGPAPAVSEAAPATPPSAEARDLGAADTGTKESLLWALGGGVLLLAGLGGAAVVRRRRNIAEVDEEEVIAAPVTPLVEKPVAQAPTFMEREPVAEPAVARAPIAAGAAYGSSLEAMVAAAPSAENPFRTHRKRLARARFLLAQQERGERASFTDAPAHVPPQTIHAEPQMQTVYRMGADRNRGMTFKPQTR
ncbi:LPXTG cell wall anchor domain-containing protein [Sphingobium sp. TomTYG45]